MTFKEQLAKGQVGEEIVADRLFEEGYMCYRPAQGGRHSIDGIMVNLGLSKENERVSWFEVKTKPVMKVGMTGFDMRHYREYLQLQRVSGLAVNVFFVDKSAGNVRWLDLSKRTEPDRTVNCKNGDVIVAWKALTLPLVWHLNELELLKLGAQDAVCA